MLLREFDQSNDFVSDLENALNLYLRNYDNESSAATISYEALSSLMQRTGSYGAINRKIVDDAIAQSDSLKNIIRTPLGNAGITLNTKVGSPEETEAGGPDLEKTDQGISKTTAQAASSAANAGLTN